MYVYYFNFVILIVTYLLIILFMSNKLLNY